jgi:hypothetical protein
MSDKRGDGLAKVLGTVASIGAGYVVRKLVTAGWKRATGKEPPSDPQDPRVSIGEALSWAVVLGVTMETARLLAQRAAIRQFRRGRAAAEREG